MRALAIRASDPQNVLARTMFHLPKSLCPPLLILPCITGSLWGFFILFLSTNLETDRKYISTSWLQYVYPIFKLTRRTPIDRSAGKVRENKSLATSLSTWQTKDYYFNGKFYLKILNPKKTWWRHLLYISDICFFNVESS